MSNPAKPGAPNLELFTEVTDDARQLPLAELAFDEMNIVEMPIALLTRDTKGRTEVSLTPDGSVRLVCADSSAHGLPNSLAPRAVLGLMWACKGEHGLQRIFEVGVRDLVTKYMWPDRFKDGYNPGAIMRSVERQINCVANTRIHSDRWYDKKLKRTVAINASIIDYVKVTQEGGRNRARRLEIGWGQAFWDSMRSQYTKGIDPYLLQRIDSPIELALYRLLDRQLATKPSQHYSSVIDLARGRLGMTGARIDAGGRTACTYVMRQLQKAITHLNFEGFAVRATFNKTTDVFSVTFTKLDPSSANEVREDDKPGELLAEFFYQAHGHPRDKQKTRIRKADRKSAVEWIDTYGFTKAMWMVEHCVSLQKQTQRPEIQVFNGLQLYESAASGAYESRQKDKAGRLQVGRKEQLDALWRRYTDALVERWDADATGGERAALEADAKATVKGANPKLSAAILRPLVLSELQGMKAERMSVVSEAEFKSAKDRPALLLERHGFDPIG